MWYSWFLDNDSEGEISVTEISEDNDVIPRGQFSAGISGGVNSTKASEPLKKGKYTFVIEALGENNLNGVFRYMFTNNPKIFLSNMTEMMVLNYMLVKLNQW